MSDITELEGRITAALDRIRRGMQRLAEAEAQKASGPDPAEMLAEAEAAAEEARQEAAELRSRLEEEQTVTAQLEERVASLKTRQDGRLAQLEQRTGRQMQRLRRFDGEIQQLRQANAALRDINSQLREANAQGLGDAHLINKAMMAEIEALRVTQSADRAELEEVLAELKPIIEEAS